MQASKMIAEIKERLGLTQPDLAAHFGVTQTTISNYALEKVDRMDSRIVDGLRDILDGKVVVLHLAAFSAPLRLDVLGFFKKVVERSKKKRDGWFDAEIASELLKLAERTLEESAQPLDMETGQIGEKLKDALSGTGDAARTAKTLKIVKRRKASPGGK